MSYSLKSQYAIHRFELEPNTRKSGTQEAFATYGILFLPMLLGGVVLFNLFKLTGFIFWASWAVLAIVLINIYVFYKRKAKHIQSLSILVEGSHIQITDSQKIYLHTNIQNLIITTLRCGKSRLPAIGINCKSFAGVIIGLGKESIIHKVGEDHPLCQPDYLLSSEKKWSELLELLSMDNDRDGLQMKT
ncbi:MAG: hypothetical protein AAFZ15_11980 [Bacteroidota bacterium]